MANRPLGSAASSSQVPPLAADKVSAKVPDPMGMEVVENDPDTAWSLWDRALSEQHSRAKPAPVAHEIFGPEILAVRTPAQTPAAAPLGPSARNPLVPGQVLTLEQRKEQAFAILKLHHHRVANTIRTLWGYDECSAYINKLALAGGDGLGNERVQFDQRTMDALLELSFVHDTQFGRPR